MASLYGRNNIFNVIQKASKDIFVPITLGGGLRTIDDIIEALRSGADKVSINTQAIKNPDLLRKASRVFGSQCIVLSVEAKRRDENSWEALIENGREKTNIDVIDWVKEAEKIGAGEILLTSVDQEGTMNGYDLELIKTVCDSVSIPVVACGGAGNIVQINELLNLKSTNSICASSIFHYGKYSPNELKKELSNNNYILRLENL